MAYMAGYNGATKTEAELEAWPMWLAFEPEFRRRLKALFDACIATGRPIGVGGGIRSTQQQTALFLSRHYVVTTGGCCSYGGRRYALIAHKAHAAPAGRSYHEPSCADGTCLAVDLVGDVAWAVAHCAGYGLVSFANVNGEPWHLQPAEIPRSRIAGSVTPPLRVYSGIAVVPPAPAKPPIVVPAPTLSVGSSGPEVARLQLVMRFWGWYAASCDGVFGPVTAWSVATMQKALFVAPDGVYGPATAAAYLRYAQAMQGLVR